MSAPDDDPFGVMLALLGGPREPGPDLGLNVPDWLQERALYLETDTSGEEADRAAAASVYGREVTW